MPPKPVTFKRIGLAGELSIRSILDDPEDILLQIGAVMLGASQRAFVDQKFGVTKWNPRYPGQDAPKLNIAGAVEDLATGPRIRKSRFTDRPALKDRGKLARSLKDAAQGVKKKGKYSVVVGTNVEYASIHQFGGTSTQKITKTIKKNLAQYLKTKEGKKFRDKLGWLFSATTLRTRVNRRPFIGIHQKTEKKIRVIIEDEMQAAMRKA